MGFAQAIGYAIQLGGSLLNAYGKNLESKEREGVARYNAQVARDKGLAQKRAKDTQNKILQDVNRGTLSDTTAMGGMRGIIMTSGSALMSQTAEYSDMIADQTEMTRQGEVARITGENKAKEYERQAKSIHKARAWQTASSLLNATNMG